MINKDNAKEFLEKYRQLCLFYGLKVGYGSDWITIESIHSSSNKKDSWWLNVQMDDLQQYIEDLQDMA